MTNCTTTILLRELNDDSVLTKKTPVTVKTGITGSDESVLSTLVKLRDNLVLQLF
ncbi:Hypothetical predicted protein [Mytilus galloprovincialis]|uniref:Uncharacterized protein n=1 Tax=Mytilus galloprovincialis TaxID=29158 RepID=A0A8B6F7S6_MYTGA|nr:Hypothetical predicted protein [Mytilus galloprovincialis]